MVRAFSLTSESLSYFIGFALLHSNPVIIISPWLSDVDLRLPVNNRVADRNIRLVDALKEFSEKRIYLVVQRGQKHNDYIKNLVPDHVTVRDVDDLHAKAVVADEFVYMGSANITHGGLTVNRELCEVLENEFGSAFEYVEKHLGLTLQS